jgi:hypothetical protein
LERTPLHGLQLRASVTGLSGLELQHQLKSRVSDGPK